MMNRLGGCGFRCPECQRVFARRKDREHHGCHGRKASRTGEETTPWIQRRTDGDGRRRGGNVELAGAAGSPSDGRKRRRRDVSPGAGDGAMSSPGHVWDINPLHAADGAGKGETPDEGLTAGRSSSRGRTQEQCPEGGSSSPPERKSSPPSSKSRLGPPEENTLSPCSQGVARSLKDGSSSPASMGDPEADDMRVTEDEVMSGSGSDMCLSPTSQGTSVLDLGSVGSLGLVPDEYPSSDDEDEEDGEDQAPWLDDIHHTIFEDAGAKVVDGEMPSMHEEVLEGKWAPFKNFTTLCFALWAMKFSRYAARDPLQGLLDVMRMVHVATDGERHAFNPMDLPTSASHFLSDVRRALPLLRVYEFPIRKKEEGSGDRETPVVSFALNEVVARNLRFREAVKQMRRDAGGRILKKQAGTAAGLKNEHVLALPTQSMDGRRRGYLSGRYSRRNPDVGIEGVVLATGTTAHVGDGVIARFSIGEGGPLEEREGRVVGLFFREEERSQGSLRRCRGSMMAEFRPFVCPSVVQGGGDQETAGGTRRYWESLGEEDIEVIEVSALQRLLDVVPEETLGGGGNPARYQPFQTIACAGFVRRDTTARANSSRNVYRVASRPWSRRGDEGLVFDLRDDKVHHPREGQAVAKFPLWVFSDAFNCFNQGGTQHSVNATYAGLGCVAGHLERRLEWSHLVSIAGPGGEWQPEHTPMGKILQALQRGCRAKMALQDETKEVFVRAGLEVIKADSVYANELCDVKKPSTSQHPCSACMVSREDLGSEKAAVARTTAQITSALQRIRDATSGAERNRIGVEEGVVLRGKDPNPYRQYASLDTPRQIPTDIFHQDALNTKKRLFQELVENILTDAGRKVVSCALKDERMYPAREKALRDITSPGGLASMTGMDFWRLSTIMLPVFRMCFVSESAVGKCVKPHVLARLRASRKVLLSPVIPEPRPNSGMNAGPLLALRALLVVASGITADLRLKTFSEDDLDRLHENMENQVRLFDDVLDIRLPTIHAGLHVAESIREHGTPVNCCRGEAKHQEVKKTMSTCSGRPGDVLRHFARRANDTLAVRTLGARVPYKARVYRESSHEWESCEVEPSVDCASVIGTLWDKLRAAHHRKRHVSTGKPRGAANWRARLSDSDAGSDAETTDGEGERTADPRSRFLPDRGALLRAYSEFFGCGEDTPSEVPCNYGDSCVTCRGLRFTDLSRDVECSNWARIEEVVEPGEVHETIVMGARLGEWVGEDDRKTPVFDAGGSDVAFVRNTGYWRGKNREFRRPLVRVLLFFSHEYGGEKHNWVVGLDYATVDEARGAPARDKTTQLPIFSLRNKRLVYPADNVEGVVHMVHACSASDSNGCEFKEGRWIHNARNRRFLENTQYERGMA